MKSKIFKEMCDEAEKFPGDTLRDRTVDEVIASMHGKWAGQICDSSSYDLIKPAKATIGAGTLGAPNNMGGGAIAAIQGAGMTITTTSVGTIVTSHGGGSGGSGRIGPITVAEHIQDELNCLNKKVAELSSLKTKMLGTQLGNMSWYQLKSLLEIG